MFKKIFYIFVAGMFVFGISTLSFAMMCGGSEHSKHQQTAQNEAVSTTAKEVVSVGNKICPVSGEKIDEKMKETYEYNGKTYNFCCPMFIEDFKKDPEKYIQKVEEELKAESEKIKPQEMSPQGMPTGMHEGHQH